MLYFVMWGDGEGKWNWWDCVAVVVWMCMVFYGVYVCVFG